MIIIILITSLKPNITYGSQVLLQATFLISQLIKNIGYSFNVTDLIWECLVWSYNL
jgi:hypothetical protein